MLAFKNAYLINGRDDVPIINAVVVIDHNKIVQAGKDVTVPDDIIVIDLKGKPLLPGFIDVHSHIGGSDRLDRPGLSSRFDSYDYAENMKAALEWGVTTIRSAGDYMPDIVSFRDDVNAGKITAPRILASGRMIQANGGHPAFTVFSANQDVIDNACVLVTDDTDIELEVKKLVDAGVDWIKAFLSDVNKMDYPNKVPRLTNSQLKRIADEAHKHGKPLMVHVEDVPNLEEAVKIGADSIEHVINPATIEHAITDNALKLLTEGNVWVVPTMIVAKRHDGIVQGAASVYSDLEAGMRKLIQAGVKIGVGCDSGVPMVPYGECVHLEMELLTSVGMSPMDAIKAATSGNAELLKNVEKFGTIEKGRAADMVVLGSNPLDDIKNTSDIMMVIRDGRVVFDRMLAG